MGLAQDLRPLFLRAVPLHKSSKQARTCRCVWHMAKASCRQVTMWARYAGQAATMSAVRDVGAGGKVGTSGMTGGSP